MRFSSFFGCCSKEISLHFLAIVFVLLSSVTYAQSGDDLDQQVQAITEELRCLVCQNQSIADSHAELAVQLKQQVREQLQQGRQAQEIRDYMTQRYGDFILYRPPLSKTTEPLWFGPLALLLLALIVAVRRIRQARRYDFDANDDHAIAPNDVDDIDDVVKVSDPDFARKRGELT